MATQRVPLEVGISADAKRLAIERATVELRLLGSYIEWLIIKDVREDGQKVSFDVGQDRRSKTAAINLKAG